MSLPKDKSSVVKVNEPVNKSVDELVEKDEPYKHGALSDSKPTEKTLKRKVPATFLGLGR